MQFGLYGRRVRYGLLGGLEVRDGERVLDLGTPKQRAVLAILLTEAGRVVSASRLTELLWGEDTPKAASGLQVYISHLRRVLEPDRAAREPARVLVTQPPGYRLVVERRDVDVFEFEDLVAAGREQAQARQVGAARSTFDSALALWRGPLLPELASEPFVIRESGRLEAVRLTAIEGAAEAALELGDHAGAAALLDSAADDHPLGEHLHALLALALYRGGRQADALRVVDRCRRALAEVSGLDPGPELRTLERQLLDQAPELDWQGPPAGPPAAAAPVATATETEPPAPPAEAGIVGREAELRVLTDALGRVAGGRGGIAVVLGEPGIGKTRLVEELVTIARGRGVATAWARCPEGVATPFWPVTELAEQLRAAGATAAQLAVGDGPSDTGPGGAGDEDVIHDRFGLYRAVATALRELARPAVLVIDDVHWADADTLRLLEHVAGDVSASPALVVLTSRPLGEDVAPALVDAMAEVSRSSSTVQVSLSGLDADDVARWLDRRSGAPVPAEVASVVHDRTAGNPLFVKELTDLLAAEGRLGDVAAVRSARTIPPGVQFVVRRRVSRLPVPSQRLLSVAAVVGRTFDVSVLAAVAGQPEADVLELLAPALDAGLVVEDASGLRFSHALVADALAGEVNAARKAAIHAAVARALAETAGPELGLAAPAIAHHAVAGLLAGTGELAVESSVRAARLAASRLADEEAAAHWANAAAALARVRPSDAPARLDALIEQAEALLRVDQLEAAKAPLLAAIELADAAGLPAVMARAGTLFNPGHVWTNEAYGHVDQRVVRALERTLEVVGDEDPAVHAELLGALSTELVFGDAGRHRAVSEQAVAAARRSGNPLTLARVLVAVAVPNRPGDHEERAARAEEIVTLAERHDLSTELTVAGLHQVALTRLELSDFGGASAALDRASALVERIPGTRFRSQLYWFQAGLAIVRAHYDEARRLLHEAHELHRRGRNYDADVLLFAGLATLAVDVGGLEELLGDIDGLLAASAYVRPTAESAAYLALELGAPDLAERVLASPQARSPLVDDWTLLFAAAAALHSRVELGHPDDAAPIADLLLPYSGRWTNSGTAPITSGPVDLALARWAAACGDTDAARRWFDTSVELLRRGGAYAWLARALVHQGRFLSATGDDAAGTAALAEARTLADQHGFVYVRRRLDAG